MIDDERPTDEPWQNVKSEETWEEGEEILDNRHGAPHHHENPSFRTLAHDLSTDPTDFEGQAVLWDGEGFEDPKKKSKGSNAVQGASAAGTRAITMQLVSFYFRYPVKAFMRLRIDYMAVARAINPQIQANAAWTVHQSTLGVLAYAVRTHGWRFIPNQVLPPLLANTSMGIILYTSYLQMLQHQYAPAGHATKRAYPPPPYWATFTAGAAAGAIQSLFAAPLDAISYRFDVNELTKHTSVLPEPNMRSAPISFWAYGRRILSEIGWHGVFAGYSLSLAKECFGYGLFFSTFEYVKQQMYYRWLSHYYGHRHRYLHPFGMKPSDPITIIRPHWSLEPMFLLGAGASASFASHAVFYPLNQIQNAHLKQLEFIDRSNALAAAGLKKHSYGWWTRYSHAYEQTYKDCRELATRNGGWRRWLYKGYLMNTMKSTPSTAAALIVFELVRRKFGEEVGLASIQHDGFEIVL
ncbi:hypothetical protein TWF102_009849 [Orbilia oligospora]|uniref:Mitochondrial carrier protein n=1 Tax=Orbilia oligospora TaxID=2813651 RepID=A0A7C8N888_ORBOL|nr:hypothetical protein TWF706_001203 [Orbilia oligospora]KAF3088894.1 hypothetical protein TWF102_009849 [Orbilia oligospora]KAF3105496.1 hypothetical protein TWF103_006569 [Orbilia oligospora]KAF3118916.1 hypothetical protein TWF703_003865 [Orbilia oligospora]KAF3120573.1 hypothetical protein TWF594_003713 [Orbilia oligospora]